MLPSESPENIAVFIDLENVAIGVKDARLKQFDIDVVLKRLVDKGNIIVRKAYADWSRFKEYKRPLHAVGVELLDMPGSKITGKNSADIKMVVDALELSYSKPHIGTFAFITGDSDFTPLVAKLRENGKNTLGIGVKNSTSPLLIDTCDEFIFYDDLVKRPVRAPRGKDMTGVAKKKQEAFTQLLEAVAALQRENRECYSSLVKETMKRKQPQFNEEYHGYRSFGKLLEDARQHKLITLRKDSRSGTWVVEDVVDETA